MSTRVGTDVQSIQEVEAALTTFGDRYRRLLFTELEREACCGHTHTEARNLAGIIAAKEAALKLLHTAFDRPWWTLVEVRVDDAERPHIAFQHEATGVARRERIGLARVSLDYVNDFAVAVVTADIEDSHEART